MDLETGKLYLVKDHSTVTNERPVLSEFHGNVNVMIYGSSRDVSLLNSVSDLSPMLEENLTADLAYTLSGSLRYIAFIGTCDYIFLQDRDLTYVKDIAV